MFCESVTCDLRIVHSGQSPLKSIVTLFARARSFSLRLMGERETLTCAGRL